MKEVLKFPWLFQRIAFQKLSSSNLRTLSCVNQYKIGYFQPCLPYQPRRGNAQTKRIAEARKLRELEREKILRKKRIPILSVPNSITVKDLAKLAQRTPEQVCFIKAKLNEESGKRYDDRINLKEKLHGPLLHKIVKGLGYRFKVIPGESVTIKTDKDIHAQPVPTDESLLTPRPPVVAVMGHVDHGKTTILDALRKTSVAKGEAGGITQSIGAFSVPLDTGQIVTFLDTPGHSVFTSMRERGAQVTDIVVLVVAADDGVMEQTIESINMAKMAETSIVVAVNKCDKKDAQPDLVINELEAYGIKCEERGGDVQAVRISALKNVGLDKLVNCIAAQADHLELKCCQSMQAQGVIIESTKDQHHGNLASVVLRQGTIKNGNILIAGTSFAKVRQMLDSNGAKLNEIKPGQAANIMGWRSLPTAGQIVLGVENEQKAKAAVKQRENEMRVLESDQIWEEVKLKRKADRKEYEKLKRLHTHRLHRIAASFQAAIDKNTKVDEVPSFNILVKADVDGSMEAIMKIIESYDCDEKCHLKLVDHGIGDLTLSEFEAAKNAGASIFLFNTAVKQEVQSQIDGSVPILNYKVIYHLVEDLIEKMNDIMPVLEEVNIFGESEVVKVYPVQKNFIAGCIVRKGSLEKSQLHRLLRDNVVVHSGDLESMQHLQSAITLASDNMEYGLMFSDISPVGIKVGDIIQSYSCEMKKSKIDWRPPGF